MTFIRSLEQHSLAEELASIRVSLEAKRHITSRLWELTETLFSHMLNKTLSNAEAENIRLELELMRQDPLTYKWKYLSDEMLTLMGAYYEKHRIRMNFPTTLSPSLMYAWLTPNPPNPRKATEAAKK